MSIIHLVPRAMLASYFAYTGWKALQAPGELSAEAQPTIDKLMPLAKRVLPAELSQKLPNDAPGLVKCIGITQLAGAAMLATGIGRRIGAALLSATLVPQILAATESEKSAELLAKDASLLGGTLLAAVDTQGKPSLWWRARLHHEMSQDARSRQRRELRRAKHAAKQAAKAE
jgi:uncharacterized membrane protein YphA (DoxX/SURF4 family)